MLASAQVRHQLRRFLAPGLAVALGVAFLAATVILGASLRSSISATLTGDLQSYAAVITSAAQTPLTTAQRDAVAQLPGVREVTATRRSVAVFAGRTVQLVTPPAPTSAARLAQGRRPMTSDEAAISVSLATASGLQLGSVADVSGGLDSGPGLGAGAGAGAGAGDQSGRGIPERPMVTVVGIVDAGRDPRFGIGQPIVFMTDEGVTAVVGDQGFTDLRVSGEGRDLVTRVAAVVAGTVVVGEEFPTADDRPIVQTGPDAAHAIANALGRAATLTTSLVAALGPSRSWSAALSWPTPLPSSSRGAAERLPSCAASGPPGGRSSVRSSPRPPCSAWASARWGSWPASVWPPASAHSRVGPGRSGERCAWSCPGGDCSAHCWRACSSPSSPACSQPCGRAAPGPWKDCILANSLEPAAEQDGPGSSPAWASSLSVRRCLSWARKE